MQDGSVDYASLFQRIEHVGNGQHKREVPAGEVVTPPQIHVELWESIPLSSQAFCGIVGVDLDQVLLRDVPFGVQLRIPRNCRAFVVKAKVRGANFTVVGIRAEIHVDVVADRRRRDEFQSAGAVRREVFVRSQ